jgi:hypothetical protein
VQRDQVVSLLLDLSIVFEEGMLLWQNNDNINYMTIFLTKYGYPKIYECDDMNVWIVDLGNWMDFKCNRVMVMIDCGDEY